MSRLANAAELRRPIITVRVPHTDLEIQCRQPDLFAQMAKGLMPQPLLAAAIRYATQVAAAGASLETPETPFSDVDAQQAEFIDRWVCAACVTPRVVLTEAEASDVAVWVEDLSLDLKLAILSATTPKPAAPAVADPALVEFRHEGPAGVAARSDGEAVRDDAVAASPPA